MMFDAMEGSSIVRDGEKTMHLFKASCHAAPAAPQALPAQDLKHRKTIRLNKSGRVAHLGEFYSARSRV